MVDDLESFLWLLIWVIAHVLKDKERAMKNNTGIKLILNYISKTSSYVKRFDVLLMYWLGEMRYIDKMTITMMVWRDAVTAGGD